MAKLAKLIQFKNDKEAIERINDIAAKVLKDNANIELSNPQILPTIVDAWLRALEADAAMEIQKCGQDELTYDVFGHFNMGYKITNVGEDGATEVEANIDPVIKPGRRHKEKGKDNDFTEKSDDCE